MRERADGLSSRSAIERRRSGPSGRRRRRRDRFGTIESMRSLAITLFIVGALPFASGIVYYLVDYRRTGKLYRKKLPWFPIIISGWVLAAVGVLLGMFTTHGQGFE